MLKFNENLGGNYGKPPPIFFLAHFSGISPLEPIMRHKLTLGDWIVIDTAEKITVKHADELVKVEGVINIISPNAYKLQFQVAPLFDQMDVINKVRAALTPELVEEGTI